ncbi:MAG: hypothetical protein GEU93_05325 [Propionibacteriales bacterium]|nr:hypothetical protein [Propionibacteriales bacterium]
MTSSPREEIPFISIGGGLGSFALVHRLRIAGVPEDDIRVISPHRAPYERFAALCRASGLLDEDKLRSDSSARMDNLWGFPSYAVEESWRTRRPGPLARVLAEPVLCDYYTPSVGLMRAGMARETDRIGWDSMLVEGSAIKVARQTGGGYLVLVRRDGADRPVAYRCGHVHLALGPAALQISPEAAEFRSGPLGGDRIVHIYEPHEHVHEALAAQGGEVLVRGTGIAASRVLQRLIDDREASGQDVRIRHLFRHYQRGDVGPIWFRKRGGYGFSHQAFNFPKAAVAGQLRDRTRRLAEDERIEFVKEIGATSTPYRGYWASQLRRGRDEGWYQAVVGEVAAFKTDGDEVVARISLDTGKALEVRAGFVIDATGVDRDSRRHPLLADLVADTDASVNPLGGLRIDEDFTVVGAESGDGRVFASGMNAQGGYLAPVDSFAGLHSAAMSIADALAGRGIGHRLTPLKSVLGWLKWMRGQQP